VRGNAAIVQIEGFSGHAGKEELIAWATRISPKPERVFLVHGEEDSLYALEQSLKDLGYTTMVPALGDGFDIALGRTETALPKQKAVDIQTKAQGSQIQQQIERLQAILVRSAQRRSPDMQLKLSILEADIRSLVEKWDGLI
jgi:metallo-beta-lactamase family protein